MGVGRSAAPIDKGIQPWENLSPDIGCELPTCLEAKCIHIYMILVEIALKHDLHLISILKYGLKSCGNIVWSLSTLFVQSLLDNHVEKGINIYSYKAMFKLIVRISSTYLLPTRVKLKIYLIANFTTIALQLILDIRIFRVLWANQSVYLSLPSFHSNFRYLSYDEIYIFAIRWKSP